MEQNLKKIEKALPALEAKIKEITSAEIKLNAQIITLYTMGNTQRITIFSDDLKNLITSGITAPIFKYVYIKFWGGVLSENDMTICFFQKWNTNIIRAATTALITFGIACVLT
jgi:hypothetical protein